MASITDDQSNVSELAVPGMAAKAIRGTSYRIVRLRHTFFTVFFIKYVFFTKTAVFLVCGCKVMKNQGVNQIFLAFL
jgi:hypothetical protein